MVVVVAMKTCTELGHSDPFGFLGILMGLLDLPDEARVHHIPLPAASSRERIAPAKSLRNRVPGSQTRAHTCVLREFPVASVNPTVTDFEYMHAFRAPSISELANDGTGGQMGTCSKGRTRVDGQSFAGVP